MNRTKIASNRTSDNRTKFGLVLQTERLVFGRLLYIFLNYNKCPKIQTGLYFGHRKSQFSNHLDFEHYYFFGMKFFSKEVEKYIVCNGCESLRKPIK